MAEQENTGREEHFSKAVRAGKRTYFFDVKSTRSNDLYLTITESKRRFTREGEKPFYEKHKIFLYREDFEKFSDGFSESVQYISENAKPLEERESGSGSGSSSAPEPVKSRFSDVEYDDLNDSTETTGSEVSAQGKKQEDGEADSTT